MLQNDPLQSECLSLVANLYGAVSSPRKFADQRAACEQWLAQQVTADTAAAGFLRLQLARAGEARAISARAGAEVPTACAVLTLDDHARVIAAGAEAWALLDPNGHSGQPLRLPLALRAFAEDACVSSCVPRAFRVPLDDGSRELAGVVLGVDKVRHAVGEMRVITLLLCDMGAACAESGSRGRADVRPFRRPAATPATVSLQTALTSERA